MENCIEILRHTSDKFVKYDNFITCRDQLPTRNNHMADWTKAVGLIFDFSYQGFNGYVTVVDYCISKNKIYFTINDSSIVYNLGLKAFKKVGFNEIIRIRYHDYNIGDIVHNKEILEVSHKGKSIIYQYKCVNDGYIGSTTQSNIKKSSGFCPVCMNCVIIEGLNDIPTVAPWMIPYFKGGYHEAKLYGANSKEVVELQCPHCGKTKKTMIINVHQHKGFSCECSDKVTYPEKCMINLLTMLNIDYKYQCGNSVFVWLGDKFHYDFYIPFLDTIIETHGGQHYKETSNKSKWTDLEIIQKRDSYKRDLALSNNIKYYIELDCSKSDIETFKKSVMDSELPILFNFNDDDIDWSRIDELSMRNRNMVKEICLYKEEHPYLTPQEIADKFNITKKGISKYYKIGEKFGWCVYNKEEIRWVSHFHRNTHYLINGHYFYNIEDITNRSIDVFGEKILGHSVDVYMRNLIGDKLFKNKYEVKKVSHKEYLTNNQVYPSYISKKIVDGLLQKYK